MNAHRDKPLTALGRNQANIIADKLLNHAIEVVWSSPLLRAYQTAEIIADRLKIEEVLIEPELIERDFGIMTGQLIADIPHLSKNNIQGDGVLYFIDPEGAETFPALLERGHQVVEKVNDAESVTALLLVSHGDIGKMIRAAYHGWSWEEALMTPYLENTGIIELRRGMDRVE